MPAPAWGSFLSIVDGSQNPVSVSNLHQAVLKELMAKKRGLTLLDVKNRSEYSSVTTTSCECSDEQETPAVSTHVADADDHLSEIASAIPLVNPEVLTLKHNAFPALVLMDEVDLGESGPSGSQDDAVFSMRATDGPTGQVPGTKPSPNNMPVSWYHVHGLQQVLWAKAEVIQRQSVSATNPDLLRVCQMCPRLATFWPVYILLRYRRPSKHSQGLNYIILTCWIQRCCPFIVNLPRSDDLPGIAIRRWRAGATQIGHTSFPNRIYTNVFR